MEMPNLAGETFVFGGGDFNVFAVTGEALVILEYVIAIQNEDAEIQLLAGAVDGDLDTVIDGGFGDNGD